MLSHIRHWVVALNKKQVVPNRFEKILRSLIECMTDHQGKVKKESESGGLQSKQY